MHACVCITRLTGNPQQKEGMEILSRITVLVAFFFATAVSGATFSGTLPGFGNLTNAVQYAVSKAKGVSIMITMVREDGVEIKLKDSGYSITTPFTSKEALDGFFRQKLELTLQKALTNSLADKSRQFYFYGWATRPNAISEAVKVLQQAWPFTFTKLGDGSYQSPDFSGVTTVLPPKIRFDVKADWIRVEVHNEEKLTMNPVIDTRWSLSDEGLNTVSLTDGYIELDTNLVISGTNGPTRTTVSLIVPQGTNQVFHFLGPMGTPIPEIPVAIGMSASEGQLNLVVSGGNVGRRLQLESTDTIGGVWRPEGDVKPGGYPPSTYSFAIEPSNRIFRVRSVNGMPIGGEAALRR